MKKKSVPAEVRTFFSAMGKKGGKKGGAMRAANMTDAQRSESARNAVKARWEKVREKTAAKPPQEE